jgi:large-conductance mechanosensitive channel
LYDKIEESRKEILSKINHFVVKQSDFTSSTIVNDLITNQINQFAQSLQFRAAKYFFELTSQQQNNYRTNVKEYKRRKKQIVKIIQKMLKINEIIRALIKFYISSKLIFVFIQKILQFLIIKYKKIDDQIKKQIHEKFQALKQSSFKN